MYYPIISPDNKNIFPIGPGGYESRWRCSESKYLELLSNDMIEWKESKDGDIIEWKPYLKFYLEGRLKQPSNLWKDIEGNKKASVDLKNIMGDKLFDFPKPVELIKKIIEISTDKDAIILDFFGGSGTTGHAVFELNKKNSNRKFILVQIPEATDEKSDAYKEGYKKISDITIERNKRVVDKIKLEILEAKKKKAEELQLVESTTENSYSTTNLGFKVFKLQKSNFPRVEFAPNPELSDAENLEALKKYIADKENQLVNAFNRDELITEILLKNNFTLNYKTVPQPHFKKNEMILAKDEEKETLICLDVSIDEDTIEYFKTNTDKKFICLERALDTTKKYNLKHYLGDKFNAF